MSTIAQQLAAFVIGTSPADLDGRHLDAAERSAFDLIGVLLAGRTSPHGRAVEDQVRAESSTLQTHGVVATVLGAGFSAAAPLAALANANAAHADDFDDMGGYGHPTAPVLPAILAAAEIAGGASGLEVLTAQIVGFEIGAALCGQGHYDQYTRCFHSTPIFGTLAASAAGARMLRLTPTQTAHALALACSVATGLGRNSGTMVKPLHAGQAAENGLRAALLASGGMRGRLDVFETRGGFWETFFGTPVDALTKIVDGLGMPFRAADALYIKRFPCCGSNHSALNGLQELLAREQLSSSDVAEVVVHRMGETSPVLRYPHPSYGLNGKFSIQFAMGTMLLRGRLGIDEFLDDRVNNPEVTESMGKIRTEILSRWDARNLGKSGGNPISITTVDGRKLEAFVRRTEMPGSPRQPIAEAELVAKFIGNARRSLSGSAVDEAALVWRHLAVIDDVRAAITKVGPAASVPASPGGIFSVAAGQPC